MAKYKAYPEYKESGVEWLGTIPTSWQMWKLSHAYEVIGSGTTPTSNNESYFQGDIPWVTTGELREKIIYDTDKKVKESTLQIFSALKIHPVGSVVIAMYGATIGRLGILGVDATTNQACCVMTKSKVINNQYLYYWLQAYRTDIIRLSSGGGQPNINQEKVSSLKVSAPALNDQKFIAAFLDHETAKIDNLIEKQQQLIELLKEKRQAVISHAVTKGLNPDVPMKDSGVEWLGEVPEHWTISRYKFCTSRVIVGIAEAATHAYSDSGTPIIRSTNIKEEGLNTTDLLYLKDEFARQNESKYLFSNDIVTVRTGYPGISAVIPETLNGSHCFTNLVSTPLHSQHSKYLTEYLNSAMGKEYFALNGWGSAQKNISVPILQNFPIAYPDSKEQREISTFVIDKRDEFSHLLEKADESIRLMQERRTALISAAVTGKIDVRDWVAPGTQDVEEPQEATV